MNAQRLCATSGPGPFLHVPSSMPTFDIILDPCVIPSLPPIGGHLGHADLMGRIRAIPQKHPTPRSRSGSLVPPRSHSLPQWPMTLSRSNSFEGRSGNNAGVGAGSRMDRKKSLSAKRSPKPSSDHSEPARPSGVERSPSFNDQALERTPTSECLSDSLPLPGVPKSNPQGRRSRNRTASDSTADIALATKRVRSQPAKHARSNSLNPSFLDTFEGCIRLASEQDLPRMCEPLRTLQALIPPSRTPSPAAPGPDTGLIHPPTLLTSLAIILEALVSERTVLRGDPVPPTQRLPILRDGSGLQVDGGQGEIDWKVMRPYILAIGSILDALTPLLQSQAEGKAVEGLVKGMKIYVGKQKKVFSEIVGMYVDRYSFVRGWWDESDMKASASEVGRWGDLYDA